MTDRDLLKKAAKAAGLKIRHWYEPGWADIGAAHDWWNPLKDDGDALRLAVKLRLNILPDAFDIDRAAVEVIANTGAEVEPFAIETLDGGDPYEATRRAIVRAAAQMGE